MKKISYVIFATVCLLSCTDNQRVKNHGGTATIELGPQRKLLNVTWKGEDNLWLLTRPMKEDEIAETYKFEEHSSFGIIEGTYIIKEQKIK